MKIVTTVTVIGIITDSVSHGSVPYQPLFAADLLKAEDVRTHVCANVLRICAQFVLLNAKQEKQALFNDFGTI